MQTGTTSSGSSVMLDGESVADASVLSHAVSLLSELAELRQQRSFCDMVLVASDDKRISAHRLILSASTPYFRAMFTGGLRESVESEVKLSNVSGATLETLVDFMYSGRVDIQDGNVEELISAACMFHLTSVVQACCKFLISGLEPSNCLGVLALGKTLSLSKLFDGAMEFAERNFASVLKCDEFVSLPMELVIELLSGDAIVVKSETDVFNGCIQWLKLEWPKRAPEAARILRCVRWPYVPESDLACLDYDEDVQFLREVPQCATLLQSAKWGEWHALGQRDKSWRRLRHSLACRGVVFAIGGETNPGRNIIADAEKFDSQVGSWEAMWPLPTARRGASAVIIDNVVYVAGGSDGFNALTDIISYDPQANCWSQVGRMLERRSSVDAVASGHTIFFIGGYDSLTACLSSAETYNTQTRQHQMLNPMGTPRSMCTAVQFLGCIYAIGGYDGSGDIRTVERYDMRTGEWQPVAAMHERRSMAGSAVVSDRLFVVGGSAGRDVFSSAEVYDITANTWTTITAMSSARSGLGVAVLSGTLYVFGGYDGVANLDSVESYDEEAQEWIPQPPMIVARRRFSCCCLVV